MVEEHPCLGLERRRCHCKYFLIPINVLTVDHSIVGSRLDHRSAVLWCRSQSMPLIIPVGNLYIVTLRL